MPPPQLIRATHTLSFRRSDGDSTFKTPLDNISDPGPQRLISAWLVLLLSCLMSACTGLGALPFFFLRDMSRYSAGIAKSIACGVMLAASFDLIHEGQPYSALGVLLGLGLGTVFIQLMHRRGARPRVRLPVASERHAHAATTSDRVTASLC